MYAVLPSRAPSLGIPLVLVGVLLSVNRFVRLVTNSWAGAVYRRRGLPGPFFAAMVGATATTLSYGVPWGFWPFLAARAIWGACWSFLRLGQLLAVLERAGDDERGRWMGRVQALARVGTMLSVMLGGYLTDRLGYRATIGLLGMLTAAGTVVAWREVVQHRRWARVGDEQPRTERQSRWRSDGPPEAAAGRPGACLEGDSGAPIAAGALRTGLALVYAGGFAQGFATSGLIMGTLSLFLLQRFGDAVPLWGWTAGVATVSGWLIGLRWAVELVLAPWSGWLADRQGRSRVVAAGSALQAAMLVLLSAAASPEVIILASIGLFVGAVLFAVSLDAAGGDMSVHHRPTVVMSRYTTAQDVGAALGPSVGYFLSDVVGLPAMYSGMAALLVLIGAAFVLWFPSGTAQRAGTRRGGKDFDAKDGKTTRFVGALEGRRKQ